MQLTTRRRRRRQAGLNLVEMMVGITIGLIVVAGASLMMTRQVKENSQLLLETQLQQDLRAAGDLMLREIRRAGYFSGSSTVWQPSGAAVATNIYAPTSASVANDDKIYYAYDRKDVGPAGTVPASSESFGFSRGTTTVNVAGVDAQVGVIYALNGATFNPAVAPAAFAYPAGGGPTPQPLTDPSMVNITALRFTVVNQPVAAGEYANPPLNAACTIGTAGCPCLVVRRVDITITGQTLRQPIITRTLTLSSRIRNDQLLPTCTVPTP